MDRIEALILQVLRQVNNVVLSLCGEVMPASVTGVSGLTLLQSHITQLSTTSLDSFTEDLKKGVESRVMPDPLWSDYLHTE